MYEDEDSSPSPLSFSFPPGMTTLCLLLSSSPLGWITISSPYSKLGSVPLSIAPKQLIFINLALLATASLRVLNLAWCKVLVHSAYLIEVLSSQPSVSMFLSLVKTECSFMLKLLCLRWRSIALERTSFSTKKRENPASSAFSSYTSCLNDNKRSLSMSLRRTSTVALDHGLVY